MEQKKTMSENNNSESNAKRSRYEMEASPSSQSSDNSSLLIVSHEMNGNRSNQNVSKSSENSSELLEMMSKIETMRSQMNILSKRLDDIQVERAAGHTTNSDSSPTESVDLSELDLVLETVDDVNQFESKLKSKDFKTAVLNSLLRIGGTTGKMDANKVVRMVFTTLFDEELKKQFTWSGRSGKAAFKDLNEIRNLIFEVVVQADRKYSLLQCDHDITYKLLKSKRPSTGRASLDLGRGKDNVSANSQTLTDLSDATDPIQRILYAPAMTPTRLLNPNVNVSDAWSYMMGSLYPQVN